MIKLHTSTDNQYYFTVCGRNGQVVLTSETYKTKQGCRKAAARENALYKVPYRIMELFK